MDRLTRRWGGGVTCNATAEECEEKCDKDSPDDCCCGCEIQEEIEKKLCDYEDAEEQGLLARLPCKVGDIVWGIRSYKGVKHPQMGIVSKMYFLPNMSLQIVVKHVCRGLFGKTVFLTKEEAEQAPRERKEHGKDSE